MNTILLQKILDILREGLAHVGDFFKDLFVSDPQDGQVIGYDADAGKWKNMSIAELSLDVTDTAGPDDIITFSEAADMPLKSLIANINVEGGTTEVNISRTGINQWNEQWEIGGYNITTGEKNLNTDKIRNKNLIPILPNTTYYKKSPAPGIYWNLYYNKNMEYVGYFAAQYNTTFTTPNNAYYMAFYTEAGYGTTYNNDISINYPATDTDYHAYNGEAETITLPSSVSSGYVDVISGKGMSGETPFTVTPVIINSTSGVNNIFADTGAVTAVYYTKAAGDIKNLVCITEDITSEITKNTTDFSDILLKVSQNNKVVSVEIYSATTAAAVNDTFLSNLPKPAMNSKVLLANTTLGEDGIILGTLKTTGELDITTSGAKTFSGLITYVAK